MSTSLMREAIASARSQPVASTITLVMVVGMVLAVMLTTGRTVGAEQQVLSSIDSAGTRSIVIRAEPSAGLTTDVLERVSRIEGIEWAAGFSSAVDVTNAGIPDGVKVPIRAVYARDLDPLGIPERSPLEEGMAWASDEALERLAMPESVGGVVGTGGATYGIAGKMATPDFLRGFEPLVLLPETELNTSDKVSVLIVIADTPALVAPVSTALLSVLGVDDPTKVTVQTSETLAELRALIENQLGSFSRGLVIALLGLTGTLLAILLYGLVTMRRKDFGRRRALGASRALIVSLLLLQTSILTVAGVVIGVVASGLVLSLSGDPSPGLEFTVALGTLAVIASLLATLAPAVSASRREPIRELRVP